MTYEISEVEPALTKNYRLGMDSELVLTIKIEYGFEYNCHESWGFNYVAEDFLGNHFSSNSLAGLLDKIKSKKSYNEFKNRITNK